MTPLRRNKILIVNDARTASTYIQMMLKSASYETQIAENGIEAIKYLDLFHFNLIITDLNMPEMDGFELTRIIRAREDYRFIPVIFVTAGDGPEVQQKAAEVGSTAFITFPFTKDRLIKVIRSLIR